MTDSDTKVLGALVCVSALLGLAPIAATTTLVLSDPSRWGESLNPVAILGMAVFGVLTVPLWPTYIPAIIITPFVMRWLSRQTVFRQMSLLGVVVASVPIGALVGFVVFWPILGLDLGGLWWQWATAGIMSGAITSSVITVVHKKWFSGRQGGARASP